MNKLYPFKFKTIYKDKIWGGKKIKTILGKNFSPLPNCGEAWVLSGVNGNQTLIENGFLSGNELNELVEVYMGDLVGEKVYERFGNEFPILIKFIDANDWLSIQVHPNNELAKKRHKGSGKTEMWYIIDAEKDSELISGFSRKVDKKTYLEHLNNKSLKDILNFEKVKTGDAFYMPSGRVHALGPGIFLAEIQQTSDITYRIYDWDRVDAKGNPRELHTEQALDAIDLNVYDNYKTTYKKKINETANIINSPYFATGIIHINQSLYKDYFKLDSFIIYICVYGSFELQYYDEKMTVCEGETILIPAEINEVKLIPQIETKILEVYII